MDIGVHLFDDLAPFYDAWFESPLGARAAALEWRLLSELAQPQPGEQALEVGVGTGYFARRMAQAGLRVAGVDISLPMLREAARKEPPLGLLRGDAGALPVQRERFDLVLTVTMLEFVPDPALVLAEMWAALRPGGRLVVAVLNAWSPWARRRATPYDQAHFFSPPELRALLRRYGPGRWGSTVFFLPSGRLLRCSRLLEALGRGCLRPFGAFLAGRVDKPAT